MSNPIGDFFLTIFLSDKGDKIINDCYEGKSILKDFEHLLHSKRQIYETYLMESIVKNQNCFEAFMTVRRLQKILDDYNTSPFIDFDKQFEKSTREYYELEYHKIRYKQTEIAVRNTQHLINTYNELFTKPPTVKNENKDVTVNHFDCGYTTEQLGDMFDGLKEEHYIPQDTDDMDFFYYFSGEGRQPQRKLKWIGNKGKLALFIGYFFNCRGKWVITEQVFEGEDKDKLKNSYNTEKYNGREKFFKEFENKYMK